MASARSCFSVLGYMAVDDEHGGVSSDVSHASAAIELDELIRSTAGARPQLIQLEELDDDQLDTLKQEFERVRERRSRSTAYGSTANSGDRTLDLAHSRRLAGRHGEHDANAYCNEDTDANPDGRHVIENAELPHRQHGADDEHEVADEIHVDEFHD